MGSVIPTRCKGMSDETQGKDYQEIPSSEDPDALPQPPTEKKSEDLPPPGERDPDTLADLQAFQSRMNDKAMAEVEAAMVATLTAP